MSQAKVASQEATVRAGWGRLLEGPASNPKVQCKVSGQTLFDPQLLPGFKTKVRDGLQTEAEWGAFMAYVGAQVGAKATGHPMYSPVFHFQEAAAIHHRSVTKLDMQLGGTKLVVLDAALYCDPKCPHCGADGAKDNGFTSNATSSKGFGDNHAVFMLSKQRLCRKGKLLHSASLPPSCLPALPPSCCLLVAACWLPAATPAACFCMCHAETCQKTWIDHKYPEQLPASVLSLLPSNRSEGSKAKTGIDSNFAELLAATVPLGLSFNAASKGFNQVLFTKHAQREQAFYSTLSERLSKGTMRHGQVHHATCMLHASDVSVLLHLMFHVSCAFACRS